MRLTAIAHRLSRPGTIVQRSEDARGERGSATAIHQLQHGVQVDRAVLGEAGGQVRSETGRDQALAAPLGGRAERRSRVCGVTGRAHAWIGGHPRRRLTCDLPRGHDVRDRRRGCLLMVEVDHDDRPAPAGQPERHLTTGSGEPPVTMATVSVIARVRPAVSANDDSTSCRLVGSVCARWSSVRRTSANSPDCRLTWKRERHPRPPHWRSGAGLQKSASLSGSPAARRGRTWHMACRRSARAADARSGAPC